MGTGFLIDTSAISKYLRDELSPKAAALMDEALDASSIISVITRIELLVYEPHDLREEQAFHLFLSESNVVNLSEEIIQKTVAVRRQAHIKLPDAIIAATAIVNDWTLLSTNDKDFFRVKDLHYQSLNAD